jgi:galactokinase
MEQMTQKVVDRFVERFERKPEVFRSPGRVNLIGEHTDYNEGFVLPAAIDKAIYFAVSPLPGDTCRLLAVDLGQEFECDINRLEKSDLGWPNYLLGVIDQLRKGGYRLSGFDCAFGGNIPIGSGLSSSAAIEGGLGFALNEIFQLGITSLDLVKLAQKAENEYVGVQCGIMDQFINIFGKARKVLRIDCRSLQHEYFPFERDDLAIVLCDTQVHRQLARSEYNVRRAQCESGVQRLQTLGHNVLSLRDANADMLLAHRSELDPVVFRRCLYVVEENRRVEAACLDLSRSDFASFGQRMYASHSGLRDQYEVSCRELDLLVDAAATVNGVLGARMMGGGFGGCTINLVEMDNVNDFSAIVQEKYEKTLRQKVKIYISHIEGGTERIG